MFDCIIITATDHKKVFFFNYFFRQVLMKVKYYVEKD